MDHGIDITVELDHDAFAEPAEAANRPTGELGRRRLGRAQHKRTADPDALEATGDDPRLEGFQIDDDVRELGHESGKFTALLSPPAPLSVRESSPLTGGPHPLTPSPFRRGGTHVIHRCPCALRRGDLTP